MRRLARSGVVAGTAAAVIGLSLVHAAAHGYGYTTSSRFAWSLAYVSALLVTAYGFGLPDVTRSRRSAWLASAGAIAVGALVISALQLVAGDALLPRAVVIGAAVVLGPWYVLCAQLATDTRTRAEERDRVVVIASPDDVAALRSELDRAAERPAVIVGELTAFEARALDPPERPLVALVERECAHVVVLDRDAQADDSVVVQAAVLHERGVRVRTMSLFYEQWLGKLPVSELERVSLLFDIGEVHAPTYARCKRLLDVVIAAGGMVALILVTPFVLIGNAISNRGSLLFRQLRVGRGGDVFEILKFRTMTPSTELTGCDPTIEADPRVTRFGGLLRRTHLDELPQVVNILRGDLSVVGPRPEQPHLATRLADKIPFYGIRHLVRPGLTGWAQVKYHYGADDVDALEKLQYEVYYLRRQGVTLDLRIVARTLRAVIGRDGR